MRFVAQEMREIMAVLGIKTVTELVGRTDKLKNREVVNHWKAKHLDLSNILYTPYAPSEVGRSFKIPQEHNLKDSLDKRLLENLCHAAIEHKKSVRLRLEVNNTDRVIGTYLGSLITRKYGRDGLDEDTIKLDFVGSAGQSFGAFVPKGMSLKLTGDRMII